MQAPTTRQPSMRALAADLGVVIGTVGRGCRELEGAGLVASRRRLGTVVAALSVPAAAASDVRQTAPELVSRAHQAGISEDTALSLLRAALVAPAPDRSIAWRGLVCAEPSMEPRSAGGGEVQGSPKQVTDELHIVGLDVVSFRYSPDSAQRPGRVLLEPPLCVQESVGA